MAYCTLDMLIDRYGEPFLREITDRADMATGEIDETAIGRAIDDAQAVIDGYLKPRYALPLVDVPALVTQLAIKLAVYGAHVGTAAEKVRRDYDDALKVLAQISTGAVRLDVAGVEPAGSGSQGVRITDRDRLFTAENLKGY
jgi:phage gp36-like protein